LVSPASPGHRRSLRRLAQHVAEAPGLLDQGANVHEVGGGVVGTEVEGELKGAGSLLLNCPDSFKTATRVVASKRLELSSYPKTEIRAPIRRWMYAAQLVDFIQADSNAILGTLLKLSEGDVEINQRNAWDAQINVLKSLSVPSEYLAQARIYLELTVPRLGRRADVVLLIGPAMFIIEFKVGEESFERAAVNQVWDYALDFKYFHETSHSIRVIPVLLATAAKVQKWQIQWTAHNDGIAHPISVAAPQLTELVCDSLRHINASPIDVLRWEQGRYLPTPTIIEAARALYAKHSVDQVSRNDAGAQNLSLTGKTIDKVIDDARRHRKKCICFVTGVPGAGKTLVGLDVATRHLDTSSETFSVFLSGNGPLVAVLREALTRDRVERAAQDGIRIRKGDAKKEVETFIQNVHHFRDEYLRDSSAPAEHVVLFDEAQRAWNLDQTSAFMQRKKGLLGFNQSEPEFLISCLDRHTDWSVIVCLVGSGQEINTGEGGIDEWFDAVLRHFPSWHVHLSSQLSSAEYKGGEALAKVIERSNTSLSDHLHLATSIRSFRAEALSRFVHEVLNFEVVAARQTLTELIERYPIMITRDLARAKSWLRGQARGNERYGLVVSSQAERLKPHAIDVRVKTDPVKWFLDGSDDTRSSYYLEDAATEFQVQGLELDWVCVVWDGDLRAQSSNWSHHQFRGTRWNKINKIERKRYLENAYRVLLTRARQGMVLVVPEGDDDDPTRARSVYDPTYAYLHSLGLTELQ
jgi:Uncharacterized conserved protein (DUF2075)